MNVLIITGGSKGIGKAIAQKYASKNHTVFSLSRNNIDLQNIRQISVDLTQIKEATSSFKMIFDELKGKNITSITLINNAGRLGKISSSGNLDTDDILKSIQLNTTIPLILSNLFIQATKEWRCKKQLISISSGAAINPYHGWSVYCSSKAAIDMMTKAIATEQNELKYGVKCVAIYPGVVDTNMQANIRKTTEKDFKNVQRFKELKQNNELYSPEFVAEKIYAIDEDNLLQNGDIIDIRKI